MMGVFRAMLDNNKIGLLERCHQLFVCSLCADPRPFSTSTASLLIEHNRSVHPGVTEMECPYCCSSIPSDNITDHIQTHDNKISMTTRCPWCQAQIGQHWRHTVRHMARHKYRGGPDGSLLCPHCLDSLPSPTLLRDHLSASQLIIFQCPAGGCLVKSHSKAALISHLNNKHNGTPYIDIRRQYTCAERYSIRRGTLCGCNSSALSSLCPPISTGTKGTNGVLATEECQLIELPYSGRVLAKLSLGLDDRLQEDLCLKMEQYSKFRVRLEVVDGQKQFVCSTCQYRSVHSLADVRKHILGCHCSVSTSYTRLCLRASRLDTNSFTLFSDRKLISFANEKLKRAESGGGGGACGGWEGSLAGIGDYSGLQLLEDSEQESPGGSNAGSVVLRTTGKRSYCSGGAGGGLDSAKRARGKQQRQANGAKMRPDSPVPEVGPPLDRSEAFDRVIQLNYSWAVLERLVLGQCPERYLPVLRQKMDVYSQHRILLTRRSGKRYFLCSHCPNCSPHGMNDIRKHILGVHARLPERFKSAAMYCSRMNRDNYGLLSDEELLKKNQDMVRWRAAPVPITGNGGSSGVMGCEEDDCDNTGVEEALRPLPARPTSPLGQDHHHLESLTSPGHNVFLSGDPGSPEDPLRTMFRGFIGAGHLYGEQDDCQDSQGSPESRLEPPIVVSSTEGRSRRSLVLKARTTSQHPPQALTNGT